jgi:hypothetical protein
MIENTETLSELSRTIEEIQHNKNVFGTSNFESMNMRQMDNALNHISKIDKIDDTADEIKDEPKGKLSNA